MGECFDISLEGTPVSHEYVAKELGFPSVDKMEEFYRHMKALGPQIQKKLDRIFGPTSSQYTFELTALAIEYFMKGHEDG